jgi:hypothetical protein
MLGSAKHTLLLLIGNNMPPPTFKRFYSPFFIVEVFGTLITTFQYKWQKNGYAHPHTKTYTQQTLH